LNRDRRLLRCFVAAPSSAVATLSRRRKDPVKAEKESNIVTRESMPPRAALRRTPDAPNHLERMTRARKTYAPARRRDFVRRRLRRPGGLAESAALHDRP
jgi:hypothetical protein